MFSMLHVAGLILKLNIDGGMGYIFPFQELFYLIFDPDDILYTRKPADGHMNGKYLVLFVQGPKVCVVCRKHMFYT